MNYSDYRKIPIYEKLWQSNSIPILEKTDITKNFPNDWLTPEISHSLECGDVEWVATSGTTSDRMQIMRPANWRAEQLNKTFNQHPILKKCWSESITRIALTTAICSQTLCFTKDPGVEKRRLGRTLYINLSSDPHTWCKKDLERMLNEISAHPPYFFDADPYYLALFLKSLQKFNLEGYLPKPQAVTLGYELSTKNIRQYIESALKAPVIDIYGSTELGYVLMEKMPQRMTLCSELTQIELLPIDSSMCLFSLIVTCTKNPFMPLIRYRSGDCVQTLQDNNPEEIKRICGREKEILKTHNGNLIPQIVMDDYIFEYAADIMLYQLHEQGKNKFRLTYSTKDDIPLDKVTENNLQNVLSDLLGVPCAILYRQTISPGLSGKFNWLKRGDLV